MRFEWAAESTNPEYRLSGLVMVRCPARSTRWYPAGAGERDPVDGIRAIWSDPVLAEAVHVASSVLAKQAGALVSGKSDLPPKRIRSLYRSLVKYALRISTRPTPFGLFGGVAMAEPGPEPLLVAGPDRHRKHARIGFSLLKELKEAGEPAQSGVRVQLNPTAHELPGRLAITVNPRGGAGNVNESVSVKLGAPVRYVLTHAADPIPLPDLVAGLAEAFPQATGDVLAGFTAELVERGILITELSLSIFDDPVARIRRTMPSPELDAMVDAIEAYRATAVGAGVDELNTVYRRLRSDDNAAQEQLQVDLSLGLTGQVPPETAVRVANAVEAMARTSFAGVSTPALRAHAERFVDVFGQCVVPLKRVLDPAKGIGAPAGYTTSAHRAADARTGPDEFAAANQRLRGELVERARRTGSRVVTLTAEDVNRLPPPPGLRPAGYDVFAFLDEDAVSIAPIGVSYPAGKAHGRFAYADPAIDAHLRRMTDLDRKAHPDVILCEIDYVSNRGRVNNVALAPSVHDHQLKITAGEFEAGPRYLKLDDILVGVADGRFYLQHAPDGRRVLFRSSNLVTPETAADMVRFLEEVSYEGYVRPAWLWGELESAVEFLPGVEFDGVLLCPPRWRTPVLRGSAAAQDQQVLAWIEAAGLPRFVQVGAVDNRLLLDVHDSIHRELLVREIRSGSQYVSEAREPGRLGSVVDERGERYATEVVFSFAAEKPDRLRPLPVVPRFDVHADAVRKLTPGSEWWYLRVQAAMQYQNDLLARFAAVAGDDWFHVRYRDPDDELRLRVRAGGTDIAKLCELLADCVSDGIATSFVVDTYHRELERYGGVDAMRVAERIFCAETAFTVAHAALCPPPATMGVAPGSGDETEFAPHARTGVELMRGYLAAFRLGAGETRDLLEFAAAGYRAEFATESPALRKAAGKWVSLAPSAEALAAANALTTAITEDAVRFHAALPGDRMPILQSLLHMFANRLGFNRQREYQVLFALLTAERSQAFKSGGHDHG